MTGAFTILGPPTGKGRPRFSRQTGRTYTPGETVKAEDRVREAWRAAGMPGPYMGPMGMALTVVTARPKSHYRSDGITLGAQGERQPLPIRKPDLSNVLKLVEDSLNGCLYHDDQQIAHASITRRWAHPGEPEHVRVVYWQATVDDVEFVDAEEAA